MGNNEISKGGELSKPSDIYNEAAKTAADFLKNVWGRIEVKDELDDSAEKAKEFAQSLLSDITVDFKPEDARILEQLKEIYFKVDQLFFQDGTPDIIQHLHANESNPYFLPILNEFETAHPAVSVLGMTNILSAEMLNLDPSLYAVWPEGMSRHDVMMQSLHETASILLYSPGFREALVQELGIDQNLVHSKIIEIQDLTVKAAESTCYIAANLGLGAASVFEKAFDAVLVPVFLAMGEDEKAQETLLNGLTERWQKALEENWSDADFNEALGDSVKQFGEIATVTALSLLASSGAFNDIPALSIAASAVVLLEQIGISLTDAAGKRGELDYRDVAVATGTAAATFVVTKLVPIVNEKLMEQAPKVTSVVAKAGVENIDALSKLTGTIVKAGLGAADSAMFQTVTEASKILRYCLDLDKDFDIKQELKNSGIAIATGSALSGAGYYLKETVRNSEVFGALVKKLTGHEYVAKYDDFGKYAANEVGDHTGGSYHDVKSSITQPDQEVHHTPADSSNDLKTGDGPSISMDKDDHKLTASWGYSKEARDYRAQQKELIDQGKWMEAIQMDIDDIRSKFGHKYDDAIKQMLAYAEKMQFGGV